MLDLGEIVRYWTITNPHVTHTENWVSYSSTWITENNYNSAVPVIVQFEKTKQVSTIIGFSGSAELKAKLSLSAEYSETQSSTIKKGVTIPAWTIWATRPYIRYKKEFWKGTKNILLTGQTRMESVEVTGVNKILKEKSK